MGNLGEKIIIQNLLEKGMYYERINSYFDLLVEYKHRVEIKTALISKKNRFQRHVGKFCFNKDFHVNTYKENGVWVCFMGRYREDFINFGLIESNKLTDKKSYTIHGVCRLPLLSFDQWCEKISYESDK